MANEKIEDLEASVVGDIRKFLEEGEIDNASMQRIEENSVLAGRCGDEALARELLRHDHYRSLAPGGRELNKVIYRLSDMEVLLGNHTPHPLTIARYFEILTEDSIIETKYPFSDMNFGRGLVNLAENQDAEGFNRLANAYVNWDRMSQQYTRENEQQFKDRVFDNLLLWCGLADTSIPVGDGGFTFDRSLMSRSDTKTQLYLKRTFKMS